MRARGRNSREYLPSEEREDYVAYARRRGCTLVTALQKNRYVDEFIRFCSSHSGHSHVKDISRMDFLNYGKWLESSCRTYATGQTKIGRAIQWFNWLAETGRIEKNPARGLVAGRLIPSPKNAREESASKASAWGRDRNA
jgi:site-specific recombinase XerC